MIVTSPIADLAAAFIEGRLAPRQALTEALARIEAFNDALECFREVDHDGAQADLARIEAARAEDHSLPLAGAVIAVKDNIATSTGATSAGARILENYTSPYTAAVVERLRAAGAIIIGKTNCDAFGMGSTTEFCDYATPRNPWDQSRVPGGSSGGSAAAVAAGMCTAALGSDTGGSVRQPASFCGCVGLKPTYGRVSRYGLIAYGSSLDQIGPITRTVDDAARILQAIAGPDPNDSTSADVGIPDYTANIEEPVRDLRIGVPARYLSDDNDPAVNQRIAEAIDTYQSLGAHVINIELDLTDASIPAYYVIAMAEASSNLARYDGVRYGRRAAPHPGEGLQHMYERSRSEGFGEEVQRRILLGTYVLSAGYYDAYYRKAMQVRRMIRNELDAAFQHCDVLLGPTSPTPAFGFDAASDPAAMYLEDIYTTTANLAGVCAISLPCGFTTRGDARLPIGMQLQAAPFNEARLLRIARMYEAATDHHTQTPPLG